MFTDDELEVARPALYRYALKLERNPDIAHDLVHITIVRMLEKRDQYQPRPGINFRSWAMSIMFSRHADEFRKSKRRLVCVSEEFGFGMADPTQDSEMAVRLDELRTAVRRLPVEQREVLYLATLGHDYDSMRRALRIPDGTVRSRLSRARETLRKHLDRP